MADGLEFKLSGLEQLRARLNEVSVDLRQAGGRSALRKAAMVVVKDAKERAARLDDPKTAQSIADNIAVQWNGRLNRRTGALAFRIGVRYGAVLPKRNGRTVYRASGSPTPHWRLLEFGTQNMRAQPFMRPALEDNIDAVINRFVSQYGPSLDAALRRAERKAAKERG